MTSALMNHAKARKDDNYNTPYEVVEKELAYYERHLYGKRIYCNADDYRISAFYRYFDQHYERLGLSSLIATAYWEGGRGILMKRGKQSSFLLEGDGDFRSRECEHILKNETDIVITNPPFSMSRKHLLQIARHGKQFLVLANQNTIWAQDVFHLIMHGEMRLGINGRHGHIPFDTYTGPRKLGFVRWITNIDHGVKPRDLVLTQEYDPVVHPRYVNYPDVINVGDPDKPNVGKIGMMPKNYPGVMALPITYFDYHDPERFEIVGFASKAHHNGYWRPHELSSKHDYCPVLEIDGVETLIYKRILVKAK